MMKKIILIGAVMVLIGVLAGCGTDKEEKETQEPKETQETKDTKETQKEEENETAGESPLQLEQPKTGDIIAEINIKDYGTVKVKFFPEQAPKAVENFTTHAKDGYYNGLTFHRIIQDFMIQGGDPLGTGTGGESIWGQPFEDEFSEELIPYKGALCMANSGQNTNGSQFFIVQKDGKDESIVQQMEDGKWPEDVIQNYKTYGGTPWLINKHTVFGQVYEGIEVIDKVAAVEADQNGKPANPVTIESITVGQY